MCPGEGGEPHGSSGPGFPAPSLAGSPDMASLCLHYASFLLGSLSPVHPGMSWMVVVRASHLFWVSKLKVLGACYPAYPC